MVALEQLPLVWIALGAFLLELILAYPDALYRRVGHPVSWMGALIAKVDVRLNSNGKRQVADFVSGLLLMLVGGAMLALAGWVVSTALLGLPYGWIVEMLMAASLLAARSLYDHVAHVTTSLANEGVEAGRAAVSQIVGRRTDELDEAAITRAAVESLGESSSDGVVAPLFWLLVAGLPGIIVYKFVNTADSLIGHRSTRHEWFGKAAARLDDALNWIPARLTGVMIALCAVRFGRAVASLQTMWRDARLHLSPNAGWPEAAMAGALQCRLGGPRIYGTTEEEGAWLGVGRADLTHHDIARALVLYRYLLGAIMLGLVCFAFLSGWPA